MMPKKDTENKKQIQKETANKPGIGDKKLIGENRPAE